MRRLVMVALCAGVLGCAMRVQGVVTDARSGRPIPGAFVGSDCYPRAVATDGGGRYDLKTRWSTCTLTVFAPGYRTRVVTVDLQDTRYPRQDVVLWPAHRAPARGARTSRR
jgi:hypothetical protein